MSEGNSLPEGWAEALLGDAVRPRSERVCPRTNGHLPYIGMEHIEPDVMRLVGTVPASMMKSASARFYPSDVLYGRLRPYLNKVYKPDFDGLCSAEFIVLPESGVLESGFLQYRINAGDFVSFARQANTGDRPRVDFDHIAGFRIKIPPLREQHRIVEKIEELFSDLDAGVVSLERAKWNLKRYRASVLKSAVEGRLTEEWRKEHPQAVDGGILLDRVLRERRGRWRNKQLLKFKEKGKEPPKNWESKYKEPAAPDPSELPALPGGWVWATMSLLADDIPHAIGAGPFGTIFKAKDFRPSGIPIIFLRHVRPGQYSTAKPGFMARDVWERLFREEYSVSGGELLVTKLGEPPGTACLYPHGVGPAMVTPDVIQMRVRTDSALAPFLMHYMNCPIGQSFTSGQAFGTTRPRLTLPLFKELPVPLPPLAEQQQIVTLVEERLSQIDSAEKTIDAELMRSKRLRQSILKTAFEGKLVSQEPNDEPASILLERLKATRVAVQPKKKAKKTKKGMSK